MSLKGNNFQHSIIHGLALETQGVGTGGTITGNTISEPWSLGRQLSFLLVGGDHGAAATATCEVEVRQRGTSTWVNQLEFDGVTNLDFTASKLADTAELEDNTILGTIDLATIDGVTYDAVRLLYTRGAQAVDVEIGAAYIISDLYTKPGGVVDDLFSKTRAS